MEVQLPVWSGHPERRPYSASITGHVTEIEDNEAMGVLDCACDTNAVAATAGGDVVGIGAHGYYTVLDVPQTRVLCTGFVQVVDIAMSGVVLLVEGQSQPFARMRK